MKKILFLVFILFNYNIFGQIVTTADLKIVNGSSVSMYFNSFYKLNNGVTYSNWIRFLTSYSSTNVGLYEGTWRLVVRSNTLYINGDIVPNTMDTRTVEIMADAGASGTSLGWRQLTNGGTVLVENGLNPVTNTSILVSIRCGNDLINYPVLGVKADYYTVDLEFYIEKGP